MSSISTLQPFRISFYKYQLNFNHFKEFENVFCGWLRFSRNDKIASQTYIYNNRTAYYIIQVTDEISYPRLDGIGIHLKKIRIPIQTFSDSTDTTPKDIDAHHYVKQLLEKSQVAKPLTNNALPIPGVKVNDIHFYFTVAEDFRQGGVFENYKFSNSDNSSKQNIFYNHHAAFYRHPQQIDSLEQFFQNDLKLKLNNSYLLPAAQQYATAFKANQVCLNTIKPIETNLSYAVESEDFYSHGALGTTNIIDFACTITNASKYHQNQVEVIPMGGNNSKLHHKSTREMYSHLLTSKQLDELEKYQINFEADLDNPNNRSFQFFFRSALGVIEGIQTQGKFTFGTRAGDGVLKGINVNLGAT